MNKKPSKTSVIDFQKYSEKSLTERIHLLSVHLYKEKQTGLYSYSMTKTRRTSVSNDLLAYGLAKIIEDILAYSGSPEDILELTQLLQEKLGYESDN